MKTIKALLLAALLAFVGLAQATTYYFCDCQTGADALCSGHAGSNANAGTVSSSPKQDLTGFTFSGAANTYAFCKGGAWTSLSSINPASGTSMAAPTVFTSYTHPSFTSSARPILNFTGTALNLNKVNYFEIANLELRGPGTNTSTKGIILSNGTGVYAHDNRITQFVIGVHGSDGDLSSRTSDMRVVNNTIDFNYALGFEGGGDRIWIENNTFDANGTDASLDHHIYIASNTVDYDNVVIRGNHLTRNRGFGGTNSTSVVIVAHGTVKNLLIEDNDITDFGTGYGHYCIAVNGVTNGTGNPQWFPGLQIRGNRCVVTGFGSIGINWTSATDAIVENNTVVHLPAVSDEYMLGISWDDAALNFGGVRSSDTSGSNSTVRNNSIYMVFNNSSPPLANTACIKAGDLGSGGDTIVNNLCKAGNAGTAAMRMFNLSSRSRASSFVTIANNIGLNGSGTLNWDETNATPGAAGESGSSIADPLFVATPAAGTSYSLQIQAGSPAVNAGHATKSSRTTFGRYYPVSTRDIGADEYNKASLAPLGVSGGSVQ